MKVEFFGGTDVGLVREINEDAFLLIPEALTLVVCDGMGGHAAGEVASREALRVLHSYFAAGPERFADKLHFNSEEVLPPGARHLVRAIRLANRRIFNHAQESSSTRGMGTTIVVLNFEDRVVSICHVGDSRAYRLRDEKLERLTVDHSLVAELVAKNEITEEESKHFAERNIITRALGTRPSVEVDIRVESTAAGDVYLACSDGLCGFVEDDLIERIMNDAGGEMKTIAKNLIKAANAVGGEDNITVALARVDNPGQATDFAGREVTVVGDADGAPSEVADAILDELAAVKLPDDEDTGKIPIIKPPSSAKPDKKKPTTSGKTRWALWLLVMAVIAIFVFFGGFDLFRSGDVPNAPPPVETAVIAGRVGEPVSAASLFFDCVDEDMLGATVYVDGEMRGTAADFQQNGLDVDPGQRHVRCVLESTTILDSLVEIHEGGYYLPLFSSTR